MQFIESAKKWNHPEKAKRQRMTMKHAKAVLAVDLVQMAILQGFGIAIG